MARPRKNKESNILDSAPETENKEIEAIELDLDQVEYEKAQSSHTITPVMDSNSKEARRRKGKEMLRKYMNEEMKMVWGTFQNFETPGAALRLQVKKYPGFEFDKTMEDGKAYEVPLYIARHLNGIDITATAINGDLGTCSYAVHSHIMDSSGNPIINTAKRKRRYGFQSAEFSMSQMPSRA